MATRIEEIVNHFNLTPHPEVGFYKRSIESSNTVSIAEHKERPIVTGIHYLLSGIGYLLLAPEVLMQVHCSIA